MTFDQHFLTFFLWMWQCLMSSCKFWQISSFCPVRFVSTQYYEWWCKHMNGRRCVTIIQACMNTNSKLGHVVSTHFCINKIFCCDVCALYRVSIVVYRILCFWLLVSFVLILNNSYTGDPVELSIQTWTKSLCKNSWALQKLEKSACVAPCIHFYVKHNCPLNSTYSDEDTFAENVIDALTDSVHVLLTFALKGNTLHLKK